MFVTFADSRPQPWLTATVGLETQKCWNLLFNNTIGVAWLQRDTVLPRQRMIIVCHLHCQAASIGHHPLQGQVVDLRDGHRAESEEPSYILSNCCQSKAGECGKIGLSLPTSTLLLLVDAGSSMFSGEAHKAPLVLVCNANQPGAQRGGSVCAERQSCT